MAQKPKKHSWPFSRNANRISVSSTDDPADQSAYKSTHKATHKATRKQPVHLTERAVLFWYLHSLSKELYAGAFDQFFIGDRFSCFGIVDVFDPVSPSLVF
jgi:hypothetical protein